MGSIYKSYEWVDPGAIQTKDYSTPQLKEMYGDVASYLYILETSIGQEQNVAAELELDCLEQGSLKDIQDKIFSEFESSLYEEDLFSLRLVLCIMSRN